MLGEFSVSGSLGYIKCTGQPGVSAEMVSKPVFLLLFRLYWAGIWSAEQLRP